MLSGGVKTLRGWGVLAQAHPEGSARVKTKFITRVRRVLNTLIKAVRLMILRAYDSIGRIVS